MKSIRQRLTSYLLASLSVLLAAGGAGVFFSTRAVLLLDFDVALRKSLPEVLGTVRQHLVDRPGPGNPVQFEFRNPSVYVQVWTPEGALIGRSVNLRGQDLRLSPAPAGTMELTLPNGNRGRAFTSVQPVFSAKPGASYREERERLLTKVPKSLVVTVAADRRELDGALRRLSRVLWTVGGLMLGLTGGVAAFVSSRGLAPLNVVAEQAGRIDASTLDFRFPMKSLPAELKSICGRLNELLSRLEMAFARERCFSADVAHELRTPIAELRSLADVALKWPSADPAVVSGFQEARDIAVQMQGIVNGLLAITRCEARTQTISRQPLAVAQMLRDAWKPFEARAAEKHLKLEWALADLPPVNSDSAMLGLILTNLFSNAVEYTPREGVVSIGLSSNHGGLDLTVSNSTQNVIAADLPHFFERFWRKDSARSSSEHSGIGLSVAQAFAQALGLSLEASLPASSTLSMRLRQMESFCGENPAMSVANSKVLQRNWVTAAGASR